MIKKKFSFIRIAEWGKKLPKCALPRLTVGKLSPFPPQTGDTEGRGHKHQQRTGGTILSWILWCYEMLLTSFTGRRRLFLGCGRWRAATAGAARGVLVILVIFGLSCSHLKVSALFGYAKQLLHRKRLLSNLDKTLSLPGVSLCLCSHWFHAPM